MKKLNNCDICPRDCKINRNLHFGSCRVGNKVKVSEFVLYPGEEPVLNGKYGAGGVFFSNCTMRCVYCQNFQFSQLGRGKEISTLELGEIFLKLQFEKKATNLDLVTATPYLPYIFEALIYAIEKGFSLPIVWNTSSYETIETLKLLEGVVDIYLADIRYTSDIVGKRYSGVKDYWTKTQLAIKEMYRQLGKSFVLDEKTNELKKGIIIRLLVLPNFLNQTKEALKFLKYEISEEIYISLMDQYVPVFKAKNYKKLSRYLYKSEYEEVISYMQELGFKNGWIQTHNLPDLYDNSSKLKFTV
ncbi:radical SAM protein [Petrotoga sp. 9PWA.NaAc.5.4]|uniref:radical SAM protein n=1 Tax=Petrotoga sp. 9PWA.NaAc.5.4 TaxID=1434328 RepID=UPI000EFC37C7|nr:radical SAM protein [Petrotoga sp. 9PWA.NaAc.5.4]